MGDLRLRPVGGRGCRLWCRSVGVVSRRSQVAPYAAAPARARRTRFLPRQLVRGDRAARRVSVRPRLAVHAEAGRSPRAITPACQLPLAANVAGVFTSCGTAWLSAA